MATTNRGANAHPEVQKYLQEIEELDREDIAAAEEGLREEQENVSYTLGAAASIMVGFIFSVIIPVPFSLRVGICLLGVLGAMYIASKNPVDADNIREAEARLRQTRRAKATAALSRDGFRKVRHNLIPGMGELTDNINPHWSSMTEDAEAEYTRQEDDSHDGSGAAPSEESLTLGDIVQPNEPGVVSIDTEETDEMPSVAEVAYVAEQETGATVEDGFTEGSWDAYQNCNPYGEDYADMGFEDDSPEYSGQGFASGGN